MVVSDDTHNWILIINNIVVYRRRKMKKLFTNLEIDRWGRERTCVHYVGTKGTNEEWFYSILFLSHTIPILILIIPAYSSFWLVSEAVYVPDSDRNCKQWTKALCYEFIHSKTDLAVVNSMTPIRFVQNFGPNVQSLFNSLQTFEFNH